MIMKNFQAKQQLKLLVLTLSVEYIRSEIISLIGTDMTNSAIGYAGD